MAKLDIEIFAGDYYERTFVLKERDQDGNDTPIDITNKEFKAEIRTDYYKKLVAEFTITKDVDNNAVTLFLDSATTEAMKKNNYVYDLEMWQTTDRISKLIYGNITTQSEVTLNE